VFTRFSAPWPLVDGACGIVLSIDHVRYTDSRGYARLRLLCALFSALRSLLVVMHVVVRSGSLQPAQVEPVIKQNNPVSSLSLGAGQTDCDTRAVGRTAGRSALALSGSAQLHR
jgi:hypothetical protein